MALRALIDDEREALCPRCHQTFSTKNRRQAYCSLDCSTLALQERLAEYQAEDIRRLGDGPRIRRPQIATCQWCTATFAPKRKEQRFCSPACVREAGQAKLQQPRDTGQDPAHGGQAAEVRREALATRARHRNALSELDDSQREYLKTVLDEGRPVIVAGSADEPKAVHFNLNGDAWRASGERWQRLIVGRSLLSLAGHGCRLKVDKDRLIVNGGFTHSTQQPEEWQLVLQRQIESEIGTLRQNGGDDDDGRGDTTSGDRGLARRA